MIKNQGFISGVPLIECLDCRFVRIFRKMQQNILEFFVFSFQAKRREKTKPENFKSFNLEMGTMINQVI